MRSRVRGARTIRRFSSWIQDSDAFFHRQRARLLQFWCPFPNWLKLPSQKPPQQNLWVEFGSGGVYPIGDTSSSCLLWRQDFHLVGEVQVGKLAPTIQKNPGSIPYFSPLFFSLWRRDFILSEKCKLKTRTHMGKLAAHFCDGSERPGFQKADQTAGKSCRNGCVNCKSRGVCPAC